SRRRSGARKPVRTLGRRWRGSAKPSGPGTAHFLTAPRSFGKIGSAHSLGKPVYDTLFLALSQETDADMVTADELLYDAARARFPRLWRLATWGAESAPPA